MPLVPPGSTTYGMWTWSCDVHNYGRGVLIIALASYKYDQNIIVTYIYGLLEILENYVYISWINVIWNQ